MVLATICTNPANSDALRSPCSSFLARVESGVWNQPRSSSVANSIFERLSCEHVYTKRIRPGLLTNDHGTLPACLFAWDQGKSMDCGPKWVFSIATPNGIYSVVSHIVVIWMEWLIALTCGFELRREYQFLLFETWSHMSASSHVIWCNNPFL